MSSLEGLANLHTMRLSQPNIGECSLDAYAQNPETYGMKSGRSFPISGNSYSAVWEDVKGPDEEKEMGNTRTVQCQMKVS